MKLLALSVGLLSTLITKGASQAVTATALLSTTTSCTVGEEEVMIGGDGSIFGPFDFNIFPAIRLDGLNNQAFAICGCGRGFTCSEFNIQLNDHEGVCVNAADENGNVIDFDKVGFGSACF